jgi:hypothetical protein
VRRAQRRGRDNVLIQALGAASAYDIKKLVRWHRRCPQAMALACHDPASTPLPRAKPGHPGPSRLMGHHAAPFSPISTGARFATLPAGGRPPCHWTRLRLDRR